MSIKMIDISGKKLTHRTAQAYVKVLASQGLIRKIKGKSLPKGDCMAAAQVAGILAAKNTPALIPLCHPLNLTYDQVLARQKYSKVVTLNCVEGWNATILWEGVLLSDIFNQAGVKPGANTVIFRAYDGYSTSLPLDYIRDNDIILAYKQNNVTLTPEWGFPFQVVAEDKYGYKWAKWITSIEVSNDSNFEGYWESRGYSQNGSTNGPMFG